MPKGTLQLITMVGRLGRDPSRIRRPQGHPYVMFSLASNSHVQRDTGEWVSHTDWWDVVCEPPLHNVATDLLRKGDLVGVVGILKKSVDHKVSILARDLQVFGSCMICQGHCPKCSREIHDDPDVRLQMSEM